MTVSNLGFSEALRAAWLMTGRNFRIYRQLDGAMLSFIDGRYIQRMKLGERVTTSALAPAMPCYWLDANNWSLTLN